MCIGCHGIPGYQASFPEVYKVPMIAGQNAKYIVSALTQYRKGDRKHPTMRGIADVAERPGHGRPGRVLPHRSQGRAGCAEPTGALPADVAGAAGQGQLRLVPRRELLPPRSTRSYPKLAGQHATTSTSRCGEYQTDNNPQVGRNNAIMMGMARPFTHAERRCWPNISPRCRPN